MKPPTIRQRVLDELRASPNPLRASILARRLGLDQQQVQRVLTDLRGAGLACRCPPARWSARPPIKGKPDLHATAQAVLAELRTHRAASTVAWLAKRLRLSRARTNHHLLCLRDLGLARRYQSGSRRTANTWRAVRP